MDASRAEYTTTVGGIGIKMDIHEPHVYPRLNEHAVSIPPGVEAYLELDKIIEKSLQPPYTDVDCWMNTTNHDVFGSKYSYAGCMIDCMYNYVFINGCNCSLATCSLYDFY